MKLPHTDEFHGYDAIVVGGGPAGLTAAIYLARFHLSTLVIDRGASRASTIPKTLNHAGFPEGISGSLLVDRMRVQAEGFGVLIQRGNVTSLRREEEHFAVVLDDRVVRARAVLLATGVADIRPELTAEVHQEALARGLLRYCPVCDGFEVTDQAIAVLGTGAKGMHEALFLRSYTAHVTLVAPDGTHDLHLHQRQKLFNAKVGIVDGPAVLSMSNDGMCVAVAGHEEVFDTVYAALGSRIHSELAVELGAKTTEMGCVVVDPHQRTSITGLYAAGDVVLGLNQISHAVGAGGVAATSIRNDLDALSPLRREGKASA